MTDFDQWIRSLGVRPDHQYGNAEITLRIFEALYDLIIDTRKQLENM